ncbi:hypothetical protein G7Z17_g9021 [Cylindrodendrum hubeiense]|uniref:Uncharacterized protein n=1 Tax=Cylindrodendrum hubeiense TaxID=595255 RepID=A0A9P5L8I2_9HYPO|nr:hypothetical protein G7Z17_g9021 [Cylindrodendrum hubeiense]
MKWTHTAPLAFLAFLQGCQAIQLSWGLPGNLTDGRYTMTFQGNNIYGQPVLHRGHGPITNDTDIGKIILPRGTEQPSVVSGLMPVSNSGCFRDASPLDPDDYFASKEALANYCEDFRVSRMRVDIALHGSVMVFVCAAEQVTKCAEWEYLEAERIFNRTCGEDRGAWLTMKSLGRSYGRGPRHARISCTNLEKTT